MLTSFVTVIVSHATQKQTHELFPYNTIIIIVVAIAAFMIITGVGLFEANAIQFGLDQLLEAPTPKLIAFIHWYYWTYNAVQLVVMHIMVGWIVIRDTKLKYRSCTRDNLSFTIVAILGLVAVGSLVLLHKSKPHLYILRAGLNPFKNIYKVLKYSWNHKVPQHRSAFTYWEEDIPRREY